MRTSAQPLHLRSLNLLLRSRPTTNRQPLRYLQTTMETLRRPNQIPTPRLHVRNQPPKLKRRPSPLHPRHQPSEKRPLRMTLMTIAMMRIRTPASQKQHGLAGEEGGKALERRWLERRNSSDLISLCARARRSRGISLHVSITRLSTMPCLTFMLLLLLLSVRINHSDPRRLTDAHTDHDAARFLGLAIARPCLLRAAESPLLYLMFGHHSLGSQVPNTVNRRFRKHEAGREESYEYIWS